MLDEFIFRLPTKDQPMENEGKQWKLIFIFRDFNIVLIIIYVIV